MRYTNTGAKVHPDSYNVPEYAATRIAIRDEGRTLIVVCDTCGELDKSHDTLAEAEVWRRSHAQMPHDDGDPTVTP